MSEQSHVQAVSHVRRDAVLSGYHPALKLHVEMQMHAVPEITFNIIVFPSDRLCEDEWPE